MQTKICNLENTVLIERYHNKYVAIRTDSQFNFGYVYFFLDAGSHIFYSLIPCFCEAVNETNSPEDAMPQNFRASIQNTGWLGCGGCLPRFTLGLGTSMEILCRPGSDRRVSATVGTFQPSCYAEHARPTRTPPVFNVLNPLTDFCLVTYRPPTMRNFEIQFSTGNERLFGSRDGVQPAKGQQIYMQRRGASVKT